ncbi:MAG: MFS transporter [Alphaproteobacteria bacterium]
MSGQQALIDDSVQESWSNITPALELRCILVIALISFVNVLDFMMVMPLGPDFAKALNIPVHNLGFVVGSYTFAAAMSGLGAALFIDRFSRKKALLFCLAGLLVATAIAAISWDMFSMMAARVLAGCFGGPLTSLSLAMVADYVPPPRRGRAMARLQIGFIVASIVGLPFGLEISSRFGWYAPFLVLAALMMVIWWMALKFLPPSVNITRRENFTVAVQSLIRCFSSKIALGALLYTGIGLIAAFLIIPNVAAHIQMNWGYERSNLGILYFAGGCISFFGSQLVGRVIDHMAYSSWVVMIVAIILCIDLLAGFVFYPNSIPVVVIFMGFVVANSGRYLCLQALSSKIPSPDQRGGFMSGLSAVNHMASALGAFIASHMLQEGDGKLIGMNKVAYLSMMGTILVPLIFYWTEKNLKRRTCASIR